jgi:hypothetical protein
MPTTLTMCHILHHRVSLFAHFCAKYTPLMSHFATLFQTTFFGAFSQTLILQYLALLDKQKVIAVTSY